MTLLEFLLSQRDLGLFEWPEGYGFVTQDIDRCLDSSDSGEDDPESWEYPIFSVGILEEHRKFLYFTGSTWKIKTEGAPYDILNGYGEDYHVWDNLGFDTCELFSNPIVSHSEWLAATDSLDAFDGLEEL